MLWDVDRNREITSIPHLDFYSSCISRLSPEQVEAIQNEIFQSVDEEDIVTAGFVGSRDWNGTPFQPILEEACNHHFDSSRLLFGIIVWVTLMAHEAYWSFGRYEINNVQVESMTYFRVHPI